MAIPRATMSVTTATEAYPQFTTKLTLKQQLRTRLFGEAQVFTDSSHFIKPTPIYSFKCPAGMWILDYKHGYPHEQHFNCPRNPLKTISCPCKT
jgi:hypothetical protein